ncbi:MAG: class IV adenylate cyclase [Acidobacteriota bacterium]
MGGIESGQEIEIKLKLASAGEGRAKLMAAGFLEWQPRDLEQNSLFDDGEGRLKARGELVRVRHYGGKVVLTYKRKGGERVGTLAGSLHKFRPELETEVADAEPLIAVLRAVGLTPVLRYEKYRTVFRREAEEGLAMLDETPIGVYLELEGEPDWIDRLAGEMGFPVEEYVTASYLTLYDQYCLSKGRKSADMVFEETGV